MTIKRAKDRIRAMMPPGSWVNIAFTANYDDPTPMNPRPRRHVRWDISVFVPGRRTLKRLDTFGETFTEVVACAESHLRRYLRYRNAQYRKPVLGFRLVVSRFNEYLRVGGKTQPVPYLIDHARKTVTVSAFVPGHYLPQLRPRIAEHILRDRTVHAEIHRKAA